MILTLAFICLALFYLVGGFQKILERLKFPEPELAGKSGETATAAEPPQTITTEDRKRLEQITANLLHYSLTPSERKNFDVWGYVREADTTKLIEIIEDYEKNN